MRAYCPSCGAGPSLADVGLKPGDEAAIVAFLKTLSDGYVLPEGD